MARSDAIGIEMPKDFPTEAHNMLVRKLGHYQPSNPIVWSELAAGWNAVATRFSSTANADQVFTASISSTNAFSSHDELHIQNESLFAFFVNGYAALESFAYAVFSIGALPATVNLPNGYACSSACHYTEGDPEPLY